MTLILIVGGIAGLYFGGEWLVTASASIGQRLGVNRLIIGLTVMAFGTSCPELATTLRAARKGSTEMAFGNVIGSNVANVGLVLGVAALMSHIRATRRFMERDVPVLLGSAGLCWYFALDGHVARHEGIILLGVLAVYLGLLVYSARSGDDALLEDVPEDPHMPMARAVVGVVLGILLLVGGAEMLIGGSIVAARDLSVSEHVIGLTIVAVGTSLPELASTIAACLKGQDDMAMGNIVGSNIFNVLAILGTTSTVHPINLDTHTLPVDMGVMLALSVLVPMLTARQPAGRPAGALLLAIYIVYMVSLSARGA